MVASPVVTRMPWWLSGVAAALLLTQWLPGAAEAVAYDRGAVFQGQLWRIFTGHFVHFSSTHLLNNLAVLLPAVWLVETRYRSDVGPLLLGSSVAIGVALLIGEPRIVEFRGASGIALAFLVYACLRGLHEQRRWRTVCLLLLAVVMAKLLAETAGWQLRNWQANEGFVPVLLSHVVGAATGGAVYLWYGFGPGGRGRSTTGCEKTAWRRNHYGVGVSPVD